ncbi:hypothetical protein ACTPOK_33000 [Streptomyces inhibens]|uniref:hypothetical protein n=1 Tax=Streptomyces inhibens TaxID=2293571 RepID=UPI00402AA635
MPESADRHEIRIRITGTNNPQQDIDDLRAWLEREPWLNRQEHGWEQRPHPTDERNHTADGPDLGDMAVGVDDLILVIVGAVAAELTKGMTIALREWLRRRREERAAGEVPAVSVGTDGELSAVGDAGPEHPDPGSPAQESGSTRED